MINPSELQIGNYLHDNKGNLCRVEKIEKDYFYAPVIEGALIYLPNHPIPLTPELLERCGWVRYDENTFWLGISTGNMQRIVVTFTEDFIIISFSDEYSGTQKAYPLMGLMGIKFHTLQNIVKILTQKQLEITK